MGIPTAGPQGLAEKHLHQASGPNYRPLSHPTTTRLQHLGGLSIKDIHVNWTKGYTALIPKVDNPRTPSDFRPITITSVLMRGLHKILAKRISRNIPIDVRQKGFKEEEGAGANILILKDLIRQAKEQPQTTYFCFIDFSKAFDSISH